MYSNHVPHSNGNLGVHTVYIIDDYSLSGQPQLRTTQNMGFLVISPITAPCTSAGVCPFGPRWSHPHWRVGWGLQADQPADRRFQVERWRISMGRVRREGFNVSKARNTNHLFQTIGWEIPAPSPLPALVYIQRKGATQHCMDHHEFPEVAT